MAFFTRNSIRARIDRLWRFFISLKLTFVLLGVIGIGAVVGMSFDQTLTYEQFLEAKPKEGVSSFLMSFFELYDAFHSWWFSLAIFMLALNLIACSIERLPRIFFDYVRPRPYLSNRRLLGLPFSLTVQTPSREHAHAAVSDFLGVHHAKAKLPHKDDYFYKERAGLGRFGVYVVHIALLIVMFSSVYATQQGVDGHILIEEGKMARFVTARGASGVTYNYDLGFYIGCDDFRLRTFVDNSPMEFESDLFISADRDHKLVQKTVRVNEPLSYAGFTFYQSSFRPLISERTVVIAITTKDNITERKRVKLNEAVALGNGDELIIEKIYEDFAGLGQALRVAKKNASGDGTYFHIFRRYQDYDRIVRDDDVAVTFVDADQRYATGLSVGKVPGISIIFSGFLLLLVGLYLCFFTTPVRYFARIEEREGRFCVMLTAAGYRMPTTVKEMFQKKVESIQSTYNESHHA